MNHVKQTEFKKIRNEIRFVGLRRTGNHGIVNWMLSQAEPPITHYNDVDPSCPYDDQKRAIISDPEAEHLNWMVYSIEDTSLAIVGDSSSYPVRSDYNGLSIEKRYDVIVLRDPFNLMASRFQRGGEWGRKSMYLSGLSVSQMWITYALEYLGYSNWLPHNRISINYNKWCVSDEYRREIAQSLGLAFNDSGFANVSQVGGGSSFDGTNMNGNAQKMSTDQRWQTLRDDDRFQALFRDPLLLDLAEQIFDFDDELTKYIRDVLRPKASRIYAFDRWVRITILQRVVAWMRRSYWLRNVYRKVFKKSRSEKLPLWRPKN